MLKQTVQLARETGIPLVATQDAHYCDPGDHDAHDLLLCIGTNATRDEEKRFRFEGQDFYLTDEQYMLDMYSDLPEAVTNTQLVAERCDVTLEFDRLQLPETDLAKAKPPTIALPSSPSAAWTSATRTRPRPTRTGSTTSCPSCERPASPSIS